MKTFKLTIHQQAAVDLAIGSGDEEITRAFAQGRRGGAQATVWPNADRARFYAYKFAWQALQHRARVRP